MRYSSPTPATPRGYEALAVSSSAVGFAVAPTARINFCMVKAETNAVRFRDDGVDPTAAVGFPLAVGETLWYNGDGRNLRFIRQSADATVHVLYYEA